MPNYFKTRQWTHPEGYKFLAVWTNAALLRFLIRKFTEELPRSEYRSKTQLDDSARSVVSNIEEGYKRPTTKEYLSFIGFSQGSLEEIKGLVRQSHQDGFLKSVPGSSLAGLGIDLKEFKGLLKDTKGEIPLEILYPPLKSLNSPLESSKGFRLTFEMFMELINKTDYLFRNLVKSLETKMAEEAPMSPREKWLKVQAVRRFEEDRKLDEELRKTVEQARAKRESLDNP
ncbi:four helix bundle protein [Patescibacteria group bacterium]|nr:four helix bundle protein [Patescibacteria group bacterium]MBU4481029.1 four helix bundle protein [Patescibacteria group bacterium]